MANGLTSKVRSRKRLEISSNKGLVVMLVNVSGLIMQGSTGFQKKTMICW